MREEKLFLRREGELLFAKPISRALLRDGRLSWGARGLFAFLWDCPANWRPNVAHLQQMGPEGRDAVRTKLRELEVLGAMRLEPIKSDNGTLQGTCWVLVAPHLWAVESPLGREERETRETGNPKLGKSDTKVLLEKDSPKKKEERNPERPVENFGILVVTEDDRRGLEALLRKLGNRTDLLRNAVAIVRGKITKNRPYVSAVAKEALRLLAAEQHQDALENSIKRATKKAP